MVLPHYIGRGLSEQERDAFGYWLAGFVDGEGCFLLYNKNRKGVPICCGRFIIALRKDDLPILDKIKRFLGCGRIYLDDKRARSRPQAKYVIYHSADLKQVVIPLFEKYSLRAKKARDFVIWKQAVELLVEIKSRKWKSVRSNFKYGGSLPKWTQEDVKRFTSWWKELRQVREYKEPDGDTSAPIVKPPTHSNEVPRGGLFSDGKW